MAFGRLERGARSTPISDINMTPLIDVMLVLLVIFMIAAPLMTSRLRLALPTVSGAPGRDGATTVDVALDAQGQLYLADQPQTPTTFRAGLERLARQSALTEVQLRADRNVPYGRVAEVIGLLQKAGLSRIGFVTVAGPPANADGSPP